MSITTIREFFVDPANLGAERTLKELSTALDSDDDKRLGIDLWCMVKRTQELKSEKNADGYNVYRWNDKSRRERPGGGAAKPKRAGEKRMPKRATKVQRKTAKVQRTAATSPAAARWALTSDGAFVNLSLERGSHEIPRDHARALVEFVRLLDRGEASA